jgi:hypothetical protein
VGLAGHPRRRLRRRRRSDPAVRRRALRAQRRAPDTTALVPTAELLGRCHPTTHVDVLLDGFDVPFSTSLSRELSASHRSTPGALGEATHDNDPIDLRRDRQGSSSCGTRGGWEGHSPSRPATGFATASGRP